VPDASSSTMILSGFHRSIPIVHADLPAIGVPHIDQYYVAFPMHVIMSKFRDRAYVVAGTTRLIVRNGITPSSSSCVRSGSRRRAFLPIALAIQIEFPHRGRTGRPLCATAPRNHTIRKFRVDSVDQKCRFHAARGGRSEFGENKTDAKGRLDRA
jgi:hypothetical protein